MPGKDGTGPFGTWKNCNGRPSSGCGAGFGRGLKMGRGARFLHGYGIGTVYNTGRLSDDNAAVLKKRAERLENELKAVHTQLDATSANSDDRTDD